jgi:hypothetical protein
MLKVIICALATIAFPFFASAETLKLDFNRGDHQYKAVITERAHAGSALFYEDDKLLGRYENLILNEPSLTSAIVTVAGGGVALEIDSEASRNKFHVIAPISVIDGTLQVDCIYKTAYDAVDETRSVGTACKKIELGKFDIHSAINDDGLIFYTDEYDWLKSIPRDFCVNPVGVEVASYRVARCSVDGVSDTKNEKIMVSNSQGELLFSIVGYELIPQKNDTGFILNSTLKNQIIVFNGNLTCYMRQSNSSEKLVGIAKISDKLNINYAIDLIENCLAGQYSYVGKNGTIGLVGYKTGNLYYFIEMGRNLVSSGLFVLDRIDQRAHGIWIGVPPTNSLSVN